MRRRDFVSLGTAAIAVIAKGRAALASRASAARIVVVGGGFGGAACALALKSLNAYWDVALIDPDERYVTCPMSNAVIAGLRTIDSITVSRSGLERRGVRIVRDRAARIEASRRLVHLGGGATLRYDRLVMAAGIRFLWGKPEGYTWAASVRMPHAWQAGAQTTLLAAQLAALPPGGVVAISVPPGPMRCPPGPFERASLIASYLKQNNPRAKILIFDANNHFPRQELFQAAWAELYAGMIEWIPVIEGGAVLRVDPSAMTLTTANGEHRADVINVIPVQAPAMIAMEAGLASDHGWCPIDARTFESTLVPNTHVIGDACIADPMPKAASSARAQAILCARAVAAAFGIERRGAEDLQSVCYSMLSGERALAIHARFEVADGQIKQLSGLVGGEASAGSAEIKNAEDWYRRIVAESFAT